MSDPYACTITPQYTNGVQSATCVDCPEIPAVAAVPAQTIVDPQPGWNASARSVLSISGDAYTQFTVPAGVVGVVCGLSNAHRNSSPGTVTHGFFVYQEGGKQYWRVIESGVYQTAAVLRAPATDVFRVERRSGVVRYFFNGRVYYTSATPLQGDAIVVACMYSAEDGVD